MTDASEERKRRSEIVETSLPSSNTIISSEEDTEDTSLLTGEKKKPANKQQSITKNDTSKFLKSVDKEIRKTVKKTLDPPNQQGSNETLNEVVSSLGSVGYRPLRPPRTAADECNGSDWGVKWWVLLLGFIVVLGLIIVLIFSEELPVLFSSKDAQSTTPNPVT